MTQQTHRDVLYSLKNEPPSEALNEEAAKEIERLKHLAASVSDQERRKYLCARLREYVADVPNYAAAEIERLAEDNERLHRAIKGAENLVIHLSENGKSGIDPASFS